MSILKRLFGFIWAAWAIAWFTAAAIIMLPFTYLVLKSPAGSFELGHQITKVWARILLVGFLVKVRRRQKPTLEKGRAYIFISNHRSQLDIPIFITSNPMPFKFLSKEEILKVPVIGFLVATLYLTVNRGSGEGRAEGMEKMQSAIKNGYSVCLYPEGTRNRGNEPLGKFYDGAFKLAVATGAPLVVATILNSSRCLPPDKGFFMLPGFTDIYWESPLDPAGYSVNELKEKASKLMLDRLQASTGK